MKNIGENKKGQKIVGTLQILTATLIWGYGFCVIRDSLNSISQNDLMTYRYVIAAILMVAVFFKHLKGIGIPTILRGAILGFFLYVPQYFQTYALGFDDTTAGRVAFITATYVVVVPFANFLVTRKNPGRFSILAACLAVPGLILLTGASAGGIGMGDIMAMVGSLGFTLQILAIDRFTSTEDPVTMTILQFIFAAIFSAIFQAFTTGFHAIDVTNVHILWPLIYLGGFSTMLGFLMQTLGQAKLAPEIASVLLSTEAVFGMLFSMALLGEHLTIAGLAGCVLMMAAVILAEQKQ